jgi:hypothetical protein
MKGYNGFIVQVEKHITDKVKLSTGRELYKDPAWELGENAPMTGKIIAVPQNNTTPAQTGDLLFFEHTITMQNSYGKKSRYCLNEKDKTYFVPFEANCMMAIAVKKQGQWHLIGRFNLLFPVKVEKQSHTPNLLLPNFNKEYQGLKEGMGIIHKLLPEAEPVLKIGDRVSLSKHSEYKVELEGQTFFAVSTDNITSVIK